MNTEFHISSFCIFWFVEMLLRYCLRIAFLSEFVLNGVVLVIGPQSVHYCYLFPALCSHLCVYVCDREISTWFHDSRDFPETTEQGKIEWLASYCYVSDYWIPGNETLYELNVRAALFPAVLRGLSVYCDRSPGSIDCSLLRRSPLYIYRIL